MNDEMAQPVGVYSNERLPLKSLRLTGEIKIVSIPRVSASAIVIR